MGLVVWQAMARKRTSHLRGRFGPEYDADQNDRFTARWEEIQASFVDRLAGGLSSGPTPSSRT